MGLQVEESGICGLSVKGVYSEMIKVSLLGKYGHTHRGRMTIHILRV